MLARLGNVIYWAATGVAILILALLTYAISQWGNPDLVVVVLGVIIAGVIWLVGRGAKYVLSGQ
jgi:hypothetical protein